MTVVLLVMLPMLPSWGQSCCTAGSVSSCTASAGLLTGFRNNSAGVRWVYVPFYAEATDEPDYTDNFHLVELFARYQITDRIKVSAKLPYRWNIRNMAGELETKNGLADTRIFGSYAILDNKAISEASKLYWEMGLSVKLPTGQYDKDIMFRSLPGNFNIGTGGMGYLLRSNMVFSKNGTGMGLTTAYQLNAKSRDGYQFGDQFTTALSLFGEKSVGKKSKLIPVGGLTYEQFAKNKFKSGNVAEGSGGKGLFLMGSLFYRHSDWQLGSSFSVPLAQNYSENGIEARSRLMLELTYFINN